MHWDALSALHHKYQLGPNSKMLFPLSSAPPSEQALIQETALVSLCLSLVVSVVDDFIMPVSCLDPSSISLHFSVSPDLLSLLV